MFHVGQKVRCTIGAVGTVEDTSAGVIYPVKVRFTNNTVFLYTKNGIRWGRSDAVLSPFEEPDAFLQDLKQLLQRYNASIEAYLYPDNGVVVLEVISNGEAVAAVYDKLNSENILP